MIHKAMICGQVEMRSNVELSAAGASPLDCRVMPRRNQETKHEMPLLRQDK